MTETIIIEARFFLISIFTGFVVCMSYDCFRILRRVIAHTNTVIAIEDIIFGIITGIELFKVILKHNNGVIRGFLIVAYGMGMYIYCKIFSKAFVNTFSYILNKLKYVLLIPFKFLRRLTEKLVNIGEKRRIQAKNVD